MAAVRVEIVAVNPRTGARSEAMLALADTGTTLTVMPGDLLARLGVRRPRRASLLLTEGRRAQRDAGEAMVAVHGDSVPCRVGFGESEDAVLLDLTAPEQLGLAVHPGRPRVEESPGGYTARALGCAVCTLADTIEELKVMVRDAVRCHYEDGARPKLIRLR